MSDAVSVGLDTGELNFSGGKSSSAFSLHVVEYEIINYIFHYRKYKKIVG